MSFRELKWGLVICAAVSGDLFFLKSLAGICDVVLCDDLFAVKCHAVICWRPSLLDTKMTEKMCPPARRERRGIIRRFTFRIHNGITA